MTEENDTVPVDTDERRLYYDTNGTVHIQQPGDSTAFTETGERTTMFCGANLNGQGLALSGLRLQDEKARGNICSDCLTALENCEATIQAFMDDGEILDHV